MATGQHDAAARIEALFTTPFLSLHEEFLACVRETRQGFVSVERVATEVGLPLSDVLAAIPSCAALVLAEDGKTVRRRLPLQRITIPDTQRHTGELTLAVD
jgi:hypothetical protein